MVRHERVILLLIAVAVSLPAVMKTRQGAPCVPVTGLSVPPSPAGFVRVEGDVLHPGMYPLSANIMTDTVIKMAEPLHSLKKLPPATVMTQQIKNGDGVRVTVMPNGQVDVVVAPIPASERMIMGIPLNINMMSAADFDRLPGIGPVIAGRIVEYRQNNGGNMTLEGLHNVEGIGAKRYELIKKYF